MCVGASRVVFILCGCAADGKTQIMLLRKRLRGFAGGVNVIGMTHKLAYFIILKALLTGSVLLLRRRRVRQALRRAAMRRRPAAGA